MEQLYYEDNPQLAIEKCAACLRAGGTAVIPAGTVYGLVALGESEEAYQQVFRIKRRAASKPIALLISENCRIFQSMLTLLDKHSELANEFRAGRLTVVVDAGRLDGLPEQIQQIQPGRVGVRYPANSPACAILEAVGWLVWGTSANLSGQPPCSTVDEVNAWLREVSPVPDLVILSHHPQAGQPSRVENLKQ